MSYTFLLILGLVCIMIDRSEWYRKKLDQRVNATLGNEENDKTVVYKYLPQPLDMFYRVGDHNVPSKLYSSMWTSNEDDLRIK